MQPRARRTVRRRLAQVERLLHAAPTASAPLEGIRVVDMTTVIAGPYTASQLADLGAEVFKVEIKNNQGDSFRAAGSAMKLDSGEVFGASFANFNRGKKSIALDAATPQGVAIVKELVATADVFLQNMRPGVADKLGLGYKDLKAVNQNLIYCSISGFGPTGPLTGEPVFDPIIQARSGLVHLQARLNSGPSQPANLVNSLIADKTTAMTACRDIIAALFARQAGTTPGGQHITVAMLDVAMQFLWGEGHANFHYFRNQQSPRTTTFGDNDGQAAVSPFGGPKIVARKSIIPETFAVYPCSDGSVALIGMQNQVKFQTVAKHFGPELLNDPRFEKPLGRMVQHLPEFNAALSAALSLHKVEDVMAVFKRADISSAPVLGLEASFRQPQVQHNGIMVEREHPQAGPVREVRQAGVFSETPLRVASPAPLYGQHTYEILRNELGYSESKIRELKEMGVVHDGFTRPTRK